MFKDIPHRDDIKSIILNRIFLKSIEKRYVDNNTVLARHLLYVSTPESSHGPFFWQLEELNHYHSPHPTMRQLVYFFAQGPLFFWGLTTS
jgi:hypothetical protein